jgi:hypothetical protein
MMISSVKPSTTPSSILMSAVCILTPIVIATWPSFSAAVLAAAASLGYEVVSQPKRETASRSRAAASVRLEIDRSEVVTDALGRDQAISVARDGVTVKFARDMRGKASLCVTGAGRTEEELRALGESLSQSVVQQYVYRKLMDEMRERGFNVVEEEVSEDHSIRIKVRHWES